MAEADEPQPESRSSAADAMALLEEAEAEAAAAEALAAAARARARAARLRREALTMAETVEDYGDAAAAAADAEAAANDAEASAAEDEAAAAAMSDLYDYDDEEAGEYDEEEFEYDEEDGEEGSEAAAAEPEPRRAAWRRRLPPLSIIARVAAVLIIGAFAGVSVYMVTQHRHAIQQQHREAAFLGGAQQGVVNMTSLDFNKAKADVQRVIDSSTGEFKDDFQHRADDFISVVAQSKAISEGTVNAAAIESVNGNSAVVLVAATSRITNSPPGKDEPPRIWRLRVTVTEAGGQYKMSKVEYVP
jgi:Mce-associated membrane protein